jgi:hypothetical protein
MKFLKKFLLLCVIFALMDPDPDSEYDPDPLTWLNPDPIGIWIRIRNPVFNCKIFICKFWSWKTRIRIRIFSVWIQWIRFRGTGNCMEGIPTSNHARSGLEGHTVGVMWTNIIFVLISALGIRWWRWASDSSPMWATACGSAGRKKSK